MPFISGQKLDFVQVLQVPEGKTIKAFKRLKPITRRILAFVMGGMLVFALPPFSLFPLIFVIFPILILALWFEQKGWPAFWLGWVFGFGFFLFGLHWIGHALLVTSEDLWWMMPFVIIGLPAILAIFVGLVTLVARFADHFGAMAMLIPPLWLLAEFARGNLFTGFPWNLLGYSLSDYALLRQGAAFIGVYGLSLGIVLMASFLAISWAISHKKVKRLSLSAFFACFFALFIPALWGGTTFSQPAMHKNKPVMVKIIQGNIPQKQKWQPQLLERNLRHYMALSKQRTSPHPEILIWPETTMPFDLDRDPHWRQTVSQLLKPEDILITGAFRQNPTADGLYNSARILNSEGEILANYDKAHLVPFGEYVPLGAILSFVEAITGMSGFVAGNGMKTIALDGFPAVGPLICYEAIFPRQVVDHTHRPQWLLNLTNDAWFGNSIGPYQHWAHAAMRAIEEGVPVIRVASTGISGIVDARGHVSHQLGLNQSGVILANLPAALSNQTFFSLYGNWPVLLFSITLLGLILRFKIRH